jgi:SAM-dependent methyltransferase
MRKSTHTGHVTLSFCPGCGSSKFSGLPIKTDLKAKHFKLWGDALVADPEFALCHRCGLIFARCRQTTAASEAYYTAFQELERRDYAVYPPPEVFLENQRRYADQLGEVLDRENVFQVGQRVLQIRAECGMHLARLRDRHGITELYGLDYFNSNLRYAREDLGLSNVGQLHPSLEGLPFTDRSYDVILCNHLLTHALDLPGVIRWLLSLLAPAGAVVFYGEENHDNYLRRRWPLPRVNNYHKQLLSPESFRNLCRVHGLEMRIVHTFRERIPWAVPSRTMVAIARAGERTPPEELPEYDYESVLSSMRLLETNALSEGAAG